MNRHTKNEQYFKTLGILGGLGPMATVYFYKMITQHTMAKCDQDHINIVISSHATTPDRTAFILEKSNENPLPVMIEEANKLVAYGADVIALPCNTAHYFYDELSRAIKVPIINIISETVLYCAERGMKKIGILATEGTVKSGSYNKICKDFEIKPIYPCENSQNIVNDIIYKEIKQGKNIDSKRFAQVISELKNQGCETIVLGCTELSLIKESENLNDYFTDSLEVLAQSTIKKCGKQFIDFKHPQKYFF